MNTVLSNLSFFFFTVLTAMFVQNMIFTRGLGVSRLVKLVGDSAVDSLTFCALLTLVQVLSAPLAYVANNLLKPEQFWYRNYIRPLVLVVCAAISFALMILFISVFHIANRKEMLAALPSATFNCAVLGPLLLTTTYNFTLIQTMGFAVGSGLGYGFAVIIVSEGQRKFTSRNIPAAFRGLPITLVYIGILAMAIYGLTGYRQAY